MLIQTSEIRRALAAPRRAWSSLQRWSRLASHADLRFIDVMRYRGELFADREFQGHLKRCLADIPYVFPGAAELYAVVRAVRPGVIVETGVASGLSSAHVLRALAANRKGVLHSIDLPNVQEGSVLPDGRKPGWIVPDSLRGRWILHLGDARKVLPDVLGKFDRIDLFLHDSDHSYEHMSFEYETALPKLKYGGLLMSDDVHLHAAWEDFCTRHGLPATRVGSLGVTRKWRSL